MKKTILLLSFAFFLNLSALQAQEPIIGEIRMFAGTFAPRGWAFCDGELLPISSNSALFSIIGTTYGGDGRTTFALPDLRGRAAIGNGKGRGLAERKLGKKGGGEAIEGSSSSSTENKTLPYLTVNYIIAVEGIYPSR